MPHGTVMGYRAREEIRVILESGELDGGDVLSGFRLKLSELLQG